METSFKPICGALLFALLLIASSYFLKKTFFGDWVDAAIYMIGAYFAFRYFMTSPIACMTRKVHDRQNLCSKFLALHLEKICHATNTVHMQQRERSKFVDLVAYHIWCVGQFASRSRLTFLPSGAGFIFKRSHSATAHRFVSR